MSFPTYSVQADTNPALTGIRVVKDDFSAPGNGQRDTARATLFCDNAVLNTSSHCLQDTYQWLALEEHTNDDGKVQEAHTADAKTQYFGNPKLSDVKHAAVCAWSPSNPC